MSIKISHRNAQDFLNKIEKNLVNLLTWVKQCANNVQIWFIMSVTKRWYCKIYPKILRCDEIRFDKHAEVFYNKIITNGQ